MHFSQKLLFVQCIKFLLLYNYLQQCGTKTNKQTNTILCFYCLCNQKPKMHLNELKSKCSKGLVSSGSFMGKSSSSPIPIPHGHKHSLARDLFSISKVSSIASFLWFQLFFHVLWPHNYIISTYIVSTNVLIFWNFYEFIGAKLTTPRKKNLKGLRKCTREWKFYRLFYTLESKDEMSGGYI